MRNSTSAAELEDLEGPYVLRSRGDEATDKIEICEFDVEIDISAFEEPSVHDL